MPAVRMISYWEGSEHSQFVKNATAIKRIWLRHGATEFRIARVHTGQNTITFRDWEALGKASQGATTDDEFLKNDGCIPCQRQDDVPKHHRRN